ncbi:hypothetical protein H8S33_13125 [Ornithinibacillus sp. BX22]|uniref:DUF3006 domain-containing protein n=1 Tax=Ornithinibacillus hominis TaxID=2763055 RepID=A0A923L743_9BACI|nr:hypothetical protein [Ornithinibacillus hominis]MBC5637752.1 hypothetical protein [Ornithinibacillus hominis]
MVKCKVIRVLLLFLLIGKVLLIIIFVEKRVMEAFSQPAEEKVHVAGVVDRIEDGEIVVILVEESKLELMVEMSAFDIALIPHVWLDIAFSKGKIVDIAIDWKRTNRERNRVNGLLEKLR